MDEFLQSLSTRVKGQAHRNQQGRILSVCSCRPWVEQDWRLVSLQTVHKVVMLQWRPIGLWGRGSCASAELSLKDLGGRSGHTLLCMCCFQVMAAIGRCSAIFR